MQTSNRSEPVSKENEARVVEMPKAARVPRIAGVESSSPDSSPDPREEKLTAEWTRVSVRGGGSYFLSRAASPRRSRTWLERFLGIRIHAKT